MISKLVNNLILHVIIQDDEVDEIIPEDDDSDSITIMIENWVEYLFN